MAQAPTEPSQSHASWGHGGLLPSLLSWSSEAPSRGARVRNQAYSSPHHTWHRAARRGGQRRVRPVLGSQTSWSPAILKRPKAVVLIVSCVSIVSSSSIPHLCDTRVKDPGTITLFSAWRLLPARFNTIDTCFHVIRIVWFIGNQSANISH